MEYYTLPFDKFKLLIENDKARVIYHTHKKLMRIGVKFRGMLELAIVESDDVPPRKKPLADGLSGIAIQKAIVMKMWNVKGKPIEVTQSGIDYLMEGLE